MENFNLKKFLVENKLTKESKLLKEDEDNYKYFDEEGAGGFLSGTVDGIAIYTLEDSSVYDTAFYALEDIATGEVDFVGIDVAGEHVSAQQISAEYGINPQIADYLAKDIASELDMSENRSK